MLNRVRGLIIGHAIGSAIGLQTKMRLRSDGATVTFPAIAGYRGRPPCAWSAATDAFIIFLKNIKGGTVDELMLAQDLSEWNAGTLDYIFTGPATASAFEKKLIGLPEFVEKPRETAAKLWNESGKRATFTEPCAYAVAGTFTQAPITEILYTSDRATFCASIISHICRGFCNGDYNSAADVDAVVAEIAAFTGDKKITPTGIFVTFSEEVSYWVRAGYEAQLAKLQLDNIGGVNNPLKVLGCVAYVLRCVRYSLEHQVLPSFRKIMYKIADECGQADINAAVCGAILGAYLGYSLLPQDWVESLHDITRLRALIEDITPQILATSASNQTTDDDVSSPTTTDDSSTMSDLSSITPSSVLSELSESAAMPSTDDLPVPPVSAPADCADTISLSKSSDFDAMSAPPAASDSMFSAPVDS